MNKSREIFLEACLKIASNLETYGFKATSKNQKLTKVTADKKFKGEIYFQSSFRNTPSDITLIPLISCYSSELKKWWMEKYDHESNGSIFATSLGYISPYLAYRAWNVATANQTSAIESVSELLEKYAVSIFQKMENISKLVGDLCETGGAWSEYDKVSLFPMDLILAYGTKDLAQQGLYKYFQRFPAQRGNATRLYQDLHNGKMLDFNFSEFVHAQMVKLAFANNLKIPKNKGSKRYS